MSFADDLKRFTVIVKERTAGALLGVATEVHKSITEGSPLTGAPGQPVDTGYLRASWQLEFAPDLQSAVIGTPASYAPVIEYGMRSRFDPSGTTGRYGVAGGLIGPQEPTDTRRKPIKSTVGGAGSVRLTVQNADAIQREEIARLTNGRP